MSDATKPLLAGGPLPGLIILLLLVALLAAAGKPVPRVDTVEKPPAAEVLRNRQHALGLLASELGASVTAHAQLPADSLPPADGGVLWIAMPGHLLDTSRVEEIRRWVEAGGTLVLAPVEISLHEGDPLALLGGIEFFAVEDEVEETEDDAAAQDDSAEENDAGAGVDGDVNAESSTGQAESTETTESSDNTETSASADAPASTGDPDAASADDIEPATCDAGFGSPFALGDGYYAWAAPREDVHVASDNDNAEGVLCGEFFCHALRVPLGRGHVLALADASIFDTEWLAELDHALIAQRLFKLQPGTTFWIVYDETVPSLAALVWHYAKPALFTALLALLLWLLAASARFGPLQPSPPTARRRLAEHVEAAGLLLARHGAHRRLWQVVHDAFWRRFLRRHPQARDADAVARMALIAQQSGLTADDVRKHLTPPATLGELPAALQKIAFLRDST